MEFIRWAGLAFSGVLFRFQHEQVERAGIGVFLDLRIPFPVSLGVEPTFQTHKLLPRQPGNGLFDLCDRPHTSYMP